MKLENHTPGLRFVNFSRQFLFLLSVYLIALILRGFLFASNDPVDVMSYARHLSNPALYPYDFYIQQIARVIPNERWIFSSLLSLAGSNIEWLSLFLHVISSMTLFAGMYKISTLFIKTELFRWLVILTIIGPLYGLNPGSCDIYYNMFISSLVAKSIGVWAVLLFLKRSFFLSILLLVPATFIHPTVGVQLFLILSASSVFIAGKPELPGLLKAWIFYLLTAGIYVILLQFKINENTLMDTSQLFEIFEFRIGHHFFPQHFPMTGVIPATILWGFSLWFFISRKSKIVYTIQWVIMTGMVFYIVFVLVIPVEIVLSSQWFKTSIWLQLFAVVALLAWLETRLMGYKILNYIFRSAHWVFPVLAVVMVILISIPGNYISNKKHEFFFTDYYSDEALIGMEAKNLTPENAVFVVPVTFTEFKYFSERSLYIDYKSVVHRKDALQDWYSRIRLVYGIDISNRRKGDDLYKKAAINYSRISAEKMDTMIMLGVNYMVMDRSDILPYPEIASNNSYVIYQLKKK